MTSLCFFCMIGLTVTPMGVSNLMPEEYFTPANIALCGERAKGGAGIVTIGENPSDCSAGKTRGRWSPSMQKRYSPIGSTVPMRLNTIAP